MIAGQGRDSFSTTEGAMQKLGGEILRITGILMLKFPGKEVKFSKN